MEGTLLYAVLQRPKLLQFRALDPSESSPDPFLVHKGREHADQNGGEG
jgi:hypothetical protein